MAPVGEVKAVHVRCDGGPKLGLGHVVGAIRLAKLLAADGADVRFRCRPDPSAHALVEAAGFAIDNVPADITPDEDVARLVDLDRESLVIVNFGRDDLLLYGELFWQLPAAGIRLVFQDNPVPPGWRAGHVIINALPHPSYEGYDPSDHPCCLDGLQYFLPHPRAEELRRSPPTRQFEEVRRVLIAMGGGASGRLTSAAIEALAVVGYSGDVDVVVGRACSDVDAVALALKKLGSRASLTVGAGDLPERMVAADLGFSAVGLTTYEMAYAGLPVLLLTSSELNAAAGENYCREYEAAEHIGRLGEVDAMTVAEHVGLALGDAVRRRKLSERALSSIGSKSNVVAMALRRLMAAEEGCLS